MSASSLPTTTSPSSLPHSSSQLQLSPLSQQIAEVQDEIKEVKEEIKQATEEIKKYNPDDKFWAYWSDKENKLRDKENKLRDQLNLLLQQQQQASAATASSATQGLGGWVRDLTCEGVEPNPGPCVHEEGSASSPHRCRCQLTKEELRELGVALLGKCPSPADGGCGHAFNLHTSVATLQQPTAHDSVLIQRLEAIQQQQAELNERLPSIQEDTHITAAVMRDLPVILSSLAHRTFNPFRESVISTERDPQFRQLVVAHYYPQPTMVLPVTASVSSITSSIAASTLSAPGPVTRRVLGKSKRGKQTVACMVSGLLGSAEQVIAAHILPHSTDDDTLAYAGLTRDEVDSARNALLLAAGIENRFDRLDISFVPLSPLTPQRYILKIWTPVGLPAMGKVGKQGYHPGDVRLLPLFGKVAPAHPLIGAYEGAELIFGSPVAPPLRRALSFQAWLAYDRAKKRGWLTAENAEAPEEFGTPNDSPFQRQRRLSRASAAIPHSDGEDEDEDEDEDEE